MIKIRNNGEFTIALTINGTQSAAAGNAGTSESAIVPFAARLKAAIARLGTAGTTGTQTVDVLRGVGSGVLASIMASGAFVTFASTSRVPTYGNATLSVDPTVFNAYDTVQIKNTAVHTTPAVDLIVLLTFERQRSGSWNDKLQTETIGADSDAIG